MATHWSLRDVTEGWSKWQIALCVGAPIALGVAGIWFYKQRRKPKVHPDDATSSYKKELVQPQTPKELAQASKNKGNKFFKGGMYQQAIDCYTEAIRICPVEHKQDISTFYQNRAAAYENLKNYQQVINDCSTALELNERYVKALTRRAKAFEALQQFKDGLEDITTVCILEQFGNNSSLQLADRILKELGKARARETYKNKKPSLPSKFFVKNYLAGFAHDPILTIDNVGKVLGSPNKGQGEGQGDVVEVEGKDTEESSREDNSDSNGDAVILEKPSAFEQAKDALESGNYENVIPLCTEEIETPDTCSMSQALLLRGTFHVLCGQGQRGLDDFDALLKLPCLLPGVGANALIKKGSILMQKEKQADALQCFTTAEDLDPKNSDVFHHRGQQYLLMERLDEAITDFQKSIILAPNFPTSFVQKAFAEHRRGLMLQSPLQMEAAHKSFEEAVLRFPQCSDAHMLFGQALCDMGRFDEADKHFEKALQLEPDNANTIVHRGLLLLQWKSDATKAVEVINSALSVDPLCEYAYEILGTVRVQQGDMESAVEMFEKAISLSKSESEMAHLYSLLDAAQVQMKVAHNLGIAIPVSGAGPV